MHTSGVYMYISEHVHLGMAASREVELIGKVVIRSGYSCANRIALQMAGSLRTYLKTQVSHQMLHGLCRGLAATSSDMF